MSRHLKFQSPADLHQAYARLSDQSWVDSCTVDVPGLALSVRVVEGAAQRRRAEAWLRRQLRAHATSGRG